MLFDKAIFLQIRNDTFHVDFVCVCVSKHHRCLPCIIHSDASEYSLVNEEIHCKRGIYLKLRFIIYYSNLTAFCNPLFLFKTNEYFPLCSKRVIAVLSPIDRFCH